MLFGGAVLAAALAGCGGTSHKAPQTQDVRGPGYAFRAPAGWEVKRASHVVSAAPAEGGPDLISVSVFRIAKRVRPGLGPRVVREVDGVAADYARRLPGRIVARATVRVGGLKGRRYDFAYTRKGERRGQRLIFLFRGRTEFQLLCAWKAPPGRDISAACAALAASFRA